MHNHPCTNLWVGWIKEKIPNNLTGESLAKYGPYWYTIMFDRACRSSGTRARCMDWRKKYAAKMIPCPRPACGCVKDTPERQAWRASTNVCINVTS